MNDLRDIYCTLHRLGICSTQADFSRNWLGRSSHYMAQIGGDPEKASLTSLQLLTWRLNFARMKAKSHPNPIFYRELRSAFVLAKTTLEGVFELRFARECNRVTAFDLN